MAKPMIMKACEPWPSVTNWMRELLTIWYSQALSRDPKTSTLSSVPMTIHSLYIYDRYGFPLDTRTLTLNRSGIAHVFIIRIGTGPSVLNLQLKAGSFWLFLKLFPQFLQPLLMAMHLHPPTAVRATLFPPPLGQSWLWMKAQLSYLPHPNRKLQFRVRACHSMKRLNSSTVLSSPCETW